MNHLWIFILVRAKICIDKKSPSNYPCCLVGCDINWQGFACVNEAENADIFL